MTALRARVLLHRDNGFTLDVDTRLPLDSFTAIYGPSGCGKTSLLYCLAGLSRGAAGTHIQLANTHWQNDDSCLPTHRRKLAFVFQDARLFPHLSVAGNLAFAEKRRHSESGPDRKQVCSWLQLEHLLAMNASELSAGQQQRVAIARALLSAPELLLMDEPLANIDLTSRRQILLHLERLQQECSIPIVYVSHDMEEVARLANRLLVMKDGRIEAEGPMLELCSRLELGLAHEEQAASIISASVQAHDPQFGLSELSFEGHPLQVGELDAERGTQIRLRIPARDISLCLEVPQATSILNILPAKVTEIEAGTGHRLLVRLRVGKQYLLARLTRKSISRLQLHAGMSVYAQIKSVALLSATDTSRSTGKQT